MGTYVAFGGRLRWCWPFFKQTKDLLQLIAINEIEIYFLLLLFSYTPGRPPATLTRLLATVDCSLNVSVAC